MVALMLMLLMAQSLFAYKTFTSGEDIPQLSNLKEGRVKILAIALYPAHYDSIELTRRLDCEITTVGLGTADNTTDFERKAFYWKFLKVTEVEMEKDCLDALSKDYDIILLGYNPGWEKYPSAVREAIIKKIENGTPLIAFGMQQMLKGMQSMGKNVEEITLSINRFPAITEKPLLSEKYYRFAKGTIALLNHQMDNRQGYLITESYTSLHDEYKYFRIANIIYKLARGVKDAQIQSVTTEGAKTVTVQLAPSEKQRVLVYTVRDEEYKPINESNTIFVKAGADSITINLPELPNGEYGIVFRLVEGSRVLDWISALFTVEYNPKILTATLANDKLLDIDTINLTLTYSDDAKGSSLLMRFEDVHGRLYYEKSYSDLPEKIELPVPKGSLSVLNFINLYLKEGQKLQDIKVVEFALPQKQPINDYPLLIWNIGGDSTKRKSYLKAAYNHGVNGGANVWYTEPAARGLAYFNMVGIPYTTILAGRLLDKHLFNEKWIGEMEERCRKAARGFSKFSGPGYTLGDEIYLSAFLPEGRFSNSPKVVGLFRDYLKNEYKDINKLNKQWDSSHAKFEDIQLNTEKELFVSDTNPSPWFDYRMFLTHEFMGLHYRFRDLIQSIDPGAKVGYDGTEQYSSYDGYDWYQYTRGLELNNTYSEYLLKGGYPNKLFNGMCVRSFTDKKNFRGCWTNGIDYTWGMNYLPWYLILCQFNSIWWYDGTFLGIEVQAFDIDLKPSPVFAKCLNNIIEIQQGAATLLMNAESSFESSPIAVHYSENNFHASTLSSGIGNHVNNLGLHSETWFKKPMFGDNKDMQELFGDVDSMGHYAAATKNFITLFHDLGFQPRMLARQEIEAGKLNSGQYKVLVLPFVESLSKGEIAEIHTFVENGGFLIADYRTATRDKHGKMYNKSPLDELFGIERSSFDLEKINIAIDVAAHQDPYGQRSYGQLRGLFFNPNIRLTKGSAAGYNQKGVPVFISNNYGKGHTLFLNSDIYSYFSARWAGTENSYKNIFRNHFVHFANVKAPYKVMVNDAWAPHTEIFSFEDAGIDYIGIIRDFSVENHSDFEVKVPLNKKSYVYSIRDNKFLGYTDVVKSVLKSGDTLLLAQSPYRIDGVKIASKRSVKSGGDINFEIAVQSNNATELSNHVVNLKIYDPNNKNKRYLNKILYLKNGKGVYVIPISLNDQKGAWKIEAKEVISGKKASRKFTVR